MNYKKEEIKELDPRQCVYSDYNDSCTNLVINGLTSSERLQTSFSHDITDGEKAILSKYPNYEAYRWFNARGACVVLRTERNEEMFTWEKLVKIN